MAEYGNVDRRAATCMAREAVRIKVAPGVGRGRVVAVLVGFHRGVGQLTGTDLIAGAPRAWLSGRWGGPTDRPGRARHEVIVAHVARRHHSGDIVVDRNNLGVRVRRISVDWVRRNVRGGAKGLPPDRIAGADGERRRSHRRRLGERLYTRSRLGHVHIIEGPGGIAGAE